MISGFATKEATLEFAKKSGAIFENYKKFQDLTLSNVGLGTYLGNPDSQTDLMVVDAVKKSIKSGINVIDSAINYRSQKAERSVGKAIGELIEEKTISRNQIFICSKNGYVTNDADVHLDFWAYVKQELTSKGVVKEGDITSGYHCMTPEFLSDQLERSLRNLNVECIDLMYLHNGVEGQIKDVPMEQFTKNLESVFEIYESKRKEGKIKFYGMATWGCFRVPNDNPQFLSLEKTIEMAKRIGGENHGFRFIQLPFNLYYDQALLAKTQKVSDKNTSFLESAASNEMGVFTSVPFMQGRLLNPGVIPEFLDLNAPLRILQFLRSCPGVLAPLIGQKSSSHLEQNLEIMKIPPLTETEFTDTLKKLTSG